MFYLFLQEGHILPLHSSENIVVARSPTHEHQLDMLVSVAALMAEEPFKLLIVDSLTSNFRTDFQGRGELADRQQKLGFMLSKLKKVRQQCRKISHDPKA